MDNRKKLPVGIEFFSELIEQDFYYVDKTGLIAVITKNWAKVNLFTRPRRFGKSLNMNMLKTFFEIGCDKSVFEGLKISEEKELCDKYMGKFPVISISLKGIEGQDAKDTLKLDALCDAFLERAPQRVEELFGDYLWNTISIRDTAVSKERKENFYHGILLCLLAHRENWLSMSNAESGLGCSDILIEIPKGRTGIVIEIKHPEDGDLDQGCEEALEQIEEKNCVAKLKQDGMRQFIKYGIACYKKTCKVVIGAES